MNKPSLRFLVPTFVFALGASLSAAEPPIPELAKWETDMITYGHQHAAFLSYLQANPNEGAAFGLYYYDAARVSLLIADYLREKGDPLATTFDGYAESYANSYRDDYVIPNNGAIPGYWNFTKGLRMHYERTSDARSKQAVILMSYGGYAADYPPASWTQSADLSREVAYAIQSYIDAESLGETRRPRRQLLVDQAYDHMDQWFIRMAWTGPGATVNRLSPFMVGLTAEALIRDWETTKDPRLIPTLKVAADWLWNNARNGDSFFYEWLAASYPDNRPTDAAPDLNMLIAPMYAFLYKETGEVKYREAGDIIFAAGVKGAWLNGYKQFNQNYRWSFDYLKWRMEGPKVEPPQPPQPPIDQKVPEQKKLDCVLSNDASCNLKVGTGSLEIYNRSGQTVFNSSISEGTYELSLNMLDNLASGFYVLKYPSPDPAHRPHTAKLIVVH